MEEGIQVYRSSQNKLFKSHTTHLKNQECIALLREGTLFTSVKIKIFKKGFKERNTNCEKRQFEKSAVAKFTSTNDHHIQWSEATILEVKNH